MIQDGTMMYEYCVCVNREISSMVWQIYNTSKMDMNSVCMYCWSSLRRLETQWYTSGLHNKRNQWTMRQMYSHVCMGYMTFSTVTWNTLLLYSGKLSRQKTSWISQFCGSSQKFSPQNLRTWHLLMAPVSNRWNFFSAKITRIFH